jgi:biopolymer transport protein TolQ
VGEEYMFGFLFNAPAWQLVAQADIMTKFVLFGLFSLSVFCVWIVLTKFLLLWRQKEAMKALLSQVKKVHTFDELLEVSQRYKNSAGGRFLLKALGEIKSLLQAGGNKRLSMQDVEHVQLVLEQALDKILSEEEQYLPVLSTSAAVSPLVGLFGTVWGLVHAFVDISQNRSADITVVAPGIAEALTTTLAGLMVAIPALVFFHYFTNELHKLEQQLWGISDKFLSIVKKTFVK